MTHNDSNFRNHASNSANSRHSYAIVASRPRSPGPRLGHPRRFHLDHPHRRRTLHSRCPTVNLPAGVSIPLRRWICLKLEGPFPFSQTGVLLSFIEPLSRNGIPIFAISTYDTDYVWFRSSSSACGSRCSAPCRDTIYVIDRAEPAARGAVRPAKFSRTTVAEPAFLCRSML